ncbi:hypothetical protein MASR1M107_12100 [Ignavibacteriales bacterium]
MKKLISLFLLVSTLFAQAPWQAPGLKVEYALNHNNTSYIFYRHFTSTINDYELLFENKLYRKNLNSGDETLLFSGKTEYLTTQLISLEEVKFISFSAEHPDSFYFAGQIVGDSSGAFITGSGIDLFFPNKQIEYFFASKQNPGKFYLKIDGEYKVSYDYCKTFQMLHQIEKIFDVSPFNDMEVTGLNFGKVVRSTDGGINYTNIYEPSYYDTVSVYYTQDSKFTLISLCREYEWINKILYSNQGGNPGTYNPTIQWLFGSLKFIAYKSPDDSLYFYHADSLFSIPLVSQNQTGATVSHVFDQRITGSATVNKSTELYLSTRDKIYKKTGNLYEEVKSVTFPAVEFDFYPLNVGDFWVYRKTGWSENPWSNKIDTIITTRIVDDTLVPGFGKYFLSDRFNYNPYFHKIERKDEKGKIFELLNWGPDSTRYEYLIDDNTLIQGDISGMRALGDQNFYCLVKDISYKQHFGRYRVTRDLEVGSWYWYRITSVDGIGIVEAKASFDFGQTEYKLKGAFVNGMVYGDTTTTGIEDELQTPEAFSVSQNFPNPFNSSTKLSFSLPFSGNVIIRVFNVLGQEVLRLYPGYLPFGKQEVLLSMPSNLHSGVYLCRIEFENKSETQKIIYLK